MSLRLHNLIVTALALLPALAAAQPVTPLTPLATTPAPAATETNAPPAAGIEGDPAFQKFTDMLEHSPFVPSGSLSHGLSAAEGAAFAGELKLTGFFVRSGVVEVSLENRSEPEKKYFLKVGDTIPDTDIKITGFDLPNRAVLMSRGDEAARLEYETEAAPVPMMAGQAKPGTPAAAVQTTQQRPPPPGQPPSFGKKGNGGGDEGDRKASRKASRQQTIERLRGMLKSNSDPATQQRLQSMISMLEKADAQESGGR
ncbi:MAG: hypothetical protein HZA91_09455 [Verrucomicrobia bacterium]|nr:hypothetical protein [Verrucomicrobiota bacterium]